MYKVTTLSTYQLCIHVIMSDANIFNRVQGSVSEMNLV